MADASRDERRAARPVRADGGHPAHREGRLRPVPGRPGQGHHPPRRRPRGGRGRRERGAARRTTTCSPPTAATTTRWPAGATPEECLAELMSKATGLCKAKGGSMHLTKARPGHARLVRDRRRAPADGGRRGLVGEAARHRAGRGGVLRRRRHQHRRLPRGAQPGRGVEAAGAVHLREQPLHGVHADRLGHRRGQPRGRPGAGVRHAGRA